MIRFGLVKERLVLRHGELATGAVWLGTSCRAGRRWNGDNRVYRNSTISPVGLSQLAFFDTLRASACLPTSSRKPLSIVSAEIEYQSGARSAGSTNPGVRERAMSKAALAEKLSVRYQASSSSQ